MSNGSRPRILYVGNILSGHGNTPTFIETLAPKLNTLAPTLAVSDKKGKVLRFVHMLLSYVRHGHSVRVILVDTYSTLNFYYALAFAFLARLTGRKYVPILRGGNLPVMLTKRPALSKFVFRGAAALVAPSNFIVKEFAKHDYAVTYIPNFINLEHYAFFSRQHVGTRLLWVRAYQDIYNPLLAVEVLNELLKRGHDATLVMVGPDKGMRQAVEKKIADYHLNDKVTLHGKMEKKEWTNLANECDIFINTTNFDNRPVTIIEAMAIGIPVISTDAGGLPDLIDNDVDGFLVPVENVNSFIVRIEDILQHPDKAKRVADAGRRKAEQFGWEQVKQQWIQVLDDAL